MDTIRALLVISIIEVSDNARIRIYQVFIHSGMAQKDRGGLCLEILVSNLVCKEKQDKRMTKRIEKQNKEEFI